MTPTRPSDFDMRIKAGRSLVAARDLVAGPVQGGREALPARDGEAAVEPPAACQQVWRDGYTA